MPLLYPHTKLNVFKPSNVNVLGVAVSAINMQEAVDITSRHLERRQHGYICVTGVHGVMEAQRDDTLRRDMNRALLCTPDGMPMVWLGHLHGRSSMGRVYGPDFMLELCRLGTRRGYRHYLYGGKPGVAARLKAHLEDRLPAIDIVGTFTPPFAPLTPAQENDLLKDLTRTRPDIVWVGLSTPKQERFMAAYAGRTDVPLFIGVGAAFDIHAGLLRDAPNWMKVSGLQWLDRLGQEPRRLWRRYLANNPKFVWDITLQLTGIRHYEIRRA
jgi:N-acetylglucosaminyldiphosphoundecaprenol N-acetyl-beta-D-mannosaminyltransferase